MHDKPEQPSPATAGDRTAHSGDELDARIKRTDGVPVAVMRNRVAQAAQDELDRQHWERSIEAHVAAHRLALDLLAGTQQHIADTYDFDLVGDTRQAATWQMAGRCIGIGRLVCDALTLGYTGEVLHLARALHEAEGLVAIFPEEEGTDLVRKWLADEGQEWVRPGAARRAQEKALERLRELIREAGGPELEDPRGLRAMIYGQQSQAAHHRRRWTQEAVAPLLRTMLTGPTTVWQRRAVTAAATLVVVEGAVVSVGDALGQFMPPGWYGERVVPFVQAFAALRDSQPLP